MSDLVERLRHTDPTDHFYDPGTMQEAADCIEALEAALREIKDQYLAPEESSAIAKAALAHDKCVHSWPAPFDGVVKCKKCGAILTEE